MVSAGQEGEGGAISVTTNTSCAARFNAAAFHRLQPLAGGREEGGKAERGFHKSNGGKDQRLKTHFCTVGSSFSGTAAGTPTNQQSILEPTSRELGKPPCLSMSVSNMILLGVCIISDFGLGADMAMYTGEKVCRSSHDLDLMCQGCSSPTCPHHSLTVCNTNSTGS